MILLDEFIWFQKYRPSTFTDCILPARLKESLGKYVKKGDLPNMIFAGSAGIGKEQPLTATVYTPSGPVTMGSLSVGDHVIGRDGKPAMITGVYPQGVKPSYLVLFSDGTTAECGLDHLWSVTQRNKKTGEYDLRTISLREMIGSGITKDGQKKSYPWKIPLCEPVEFEQQPVPIDPYVMGVLIGDGYLGGSTIVVSCPDMDRDIIDRLGSLVGDGFDIQECRAPVCPRYTIKSRDPNHNTLRMILEHYGLNVGSKDKFIPQIYIYNDVDTRLRILAGLMDTDGSTKDGRTTFSTSSEVLGECVADLVRSLGGVATVHLYRSDEWVVRIRTNFNPFMCERKKLAWKSPVHKHIHKSVVDVAFVGDKEQQCIMVDNEDHLYLTDFYNVTHNTTVAKAMLKDIGAEVLFLNGSGKDRGIDTVKYKIESFATTASFTTNRRFVMYDEIDNLTADSQMALRSVIESVSSNCGFLGTANYPNRVTDALRSRMEVVDFAVKKDEKNEVCKELLKRLVHICKVEGVEPDVKALMEIIKSRYPDVRRMINALQNSIGEDGKINPALASRNTEGFPALIKAMSERKWSSVHEWVLEETIPAADVLAHFYANATSIFVKTTLPSAILILNDGQQQLVNSIDPKLCTIAMLTNLMKDCSFE